MARTSAKMVACLSKSEHQRVSHGSGLTGSGLTVCSPVYSPWPDHRTRVNARGDSGSCVKQASKLTQHSSTTQEGITTGFNAPVGDLDSSRYR